MSNLALARWKLGKLDEAERLHRAAVSGFRSLLGDDHQETLSAINNLATLYQDQGRFAEAVPLLEQARDGFERLLGPSHTATIRATGNLGMVFLRGLKQPHRAAETFRRLLETQERTSTAGDPDLLKTTYYLATALVSAGQYDEAESVLRACAFADSENLSEPPVLSAALMKTYADVLARKGDLSASEKYYRSAIPIFEEAHNASLTNDATWRLAAVLRDQGGSERHAEAELLWLKVIEAVESQGTPGAHETLRIVLEHLKTLYRPDHMNDPDKLKEIEAKLAEQTNSEPGGT